MKELARIMVALVAGLALALVLVFAAGPSAVFADDQPDGTDIDPLQDEDGTWGPGTITATADVIIQSGVVITVAPNTTIVVTDGVGFTIDGDLHSDGLITFTTASSPAVPGAWKGITYADGSTGYLNQAMVEYAVHALTLNTLNPITISNSTIRYNKHAPSSGADAFGAGIAIIDGSHLISNSQIYSNELLGVGGGGDAFGGGIDIQGPGSQIVNSSVHSNSIQTTGAAKAVGGGIAIRGDNNASLIEGCEVISNTVRAQSAYGSPTNESGHGGGIGVLDNTTAVIRDNRIADNRSLSQHAAGGGIAFSYQARAQLVEGNVIQRNYISGTGWCEGGGIDLWDQNVVVINNNLIIGNTTGVCGRTTPYGGGLSANATDPGVFVINNTIVGNQAVESGTGDGRGGGVYLQAGTDSNLVVQNNIIANNRAGYRGGGVYRQNGTVDYNDIFGNTAFEGADSYGIVGPNNISGDPLFVGTGDLAQQYHISPSSPAVDTGVGSGTGLPNDDYDDEPRPVNGAYDMGFDEVVPHLMVIKDGSPDPVKPGEVLNYSIVITNSGPGGAPSMTVSDTLPLNTQYVPGSITIDPPGAGTAGSAPPTLATGVTVNAGERVTVTYAVTVSKSPLPPGVLWIDNVVDVSGQGFGARATSATRVNYPPVAVDDTGSTDEENSVTIDVLGNDTDLNGDTLSVNSVGTTGTQGTVANNGMDVTYDPAGAFDYLAVGESATDVFTYTVSDGNGGTDTATVVVTVTGVNDGPTAVDDVAGTDEDSSVVVDVLGNDSDPDGSDVLSVVSVGTTGTQGTVTNNGTDVTYDPAGAFDYLAVGESATDVFTYTVSDGNGGTDTATVVVTVTGVNDDPVANDDTANTDEDTAVTIDVLNNDTDIEGDGLAVDSVTPPGNGIVANYGSYVVYTPADDFNGTDTFNYTARDGNGGFGTATVTVTVSPINDAPVANDDTANTDEDTAVTIDVLDNDRDVDGDTLVVDWVTQPATGTVVNNGSDVTYTPNADFHGTDTFAYGVSDGNGGSDIAMVVVTVKAVNDDPVANDDTAATDEDTAVTIDVLDNDSDVDGDSLIVDAIGAPTTGTVTINLDYTVTYTPDLDFVGTDSFTYTVSDGNGGSAMASVTVRVGGVNDAPVADDDVATTDEDTAVIIDVLANDTDLDGDTLFVDSVTQPASGSVVNNGGDVTYTPDADFNGEDTFSYVVSDGFGGTDTATVTVTVNGVNDDPDAVDDSATVAEDSVDNVIDVLGNDTDAPDVGETLTILAVGLPDSGGSASTDGSMVRYTPVGDFFGTETFTYTVDDGNGGTDAATVRVFVEAVNDAPTLADVSKTGYQNATMMFALSDFVEQFTDVDDDGLVQVRVTSLPGHGTLYLDVNVVAPDEEIAAGDLDSLTYEPDADYVGLDSFGWNASDGLAYAVSDAQVNLTIEPAPPPLTWYVYVPLVVYIPAPAPVPGPYPDLVVESITVASDSARVVIRNQGDAPVLAEATFWVDLYVDPNPVPTGVNQTWNGRCRYGLVWGVTPPLLPMAPGDTIVLTMGDVYYHEDLSDFPESLAAGTPIYVQVDSANAETDYGGVLEGHEVGGQAYNNISGPVLSTDTAVGEKPATPAGTDERLAASYHLPPRP